VNYHFKLPVCRVPKEISSLFDGTDSGHSTKAPLKTSGGQRVVLLAQ